jgi:hypothetical protein
MKNPHAQALGRLGGKAKSPAKTAAVRRNARLGGAPSRYRVVDGVLQRKDAGRWRILHPPYDAAAKAYLRRQRNRKD